MSPQSPMRKIHVIHAHPYPRASKVNHALLDEVLATPGIQVHELYELYPNFHIDVEREQQALLNADVVIFLHPMYWYSCPALMKEWIDSVLLLGFAYGEGGTALKGKYWLNVISTGGPEEAYARSGYNFFEIEELLRPFEQTAYLCGMIPLRPFVTHSAGKLSFKDVGAQVLQFRGMLRGIQQGTMPEAYLTRTSQQ